MIYLYYHNLTAEFETLAVIVSPDFFVRYRIVE